MRDSIPGSLLCPVGLLDSPHFDAIAKDRGWVENAATGGQMAEMRARMQLLADAAATGAGLHIVHFGSSGGAGPRMTIIPDRGRHLSDPNARRPGRQRGET